jgi:phage host-nuclease inhibitor protein Gam
LFPHLQILQTISASHTMSNRIRITAPTIRTRADAEAAVREITLLTIERNRLILERDKAITEINKRYEEPLAKADTDLKSKTELLRNWAESSPDDFRASKSLPMTHGTLGFRIGQPTLKTLSGFTWDRVLERLQTAGALDYIRVKREVDKQRILADRETLGPEQLRALGIRVAQDEAFFLEPNISAVENRQEIDA